MVSFDSPADLCSLWLALTTPTTNCRFFPSSCIKTLQKRHYYFKIMFIIEICNLWVTTTVNVFRVSSNVDKSQWSCIQGSSILSVQTGDFVFHGQFLFFCMCFIFLSSIATDYALLLKFEVRFKINFFY